MAKRVIIAMGSPRRNGNCAILAEKAAAGARAGGAAVETLYLHEIAMKPCDACDACKSDAATGCVIDDELSALMPRVREADALLLASPVYWFTYSAQTKLFIDRVFYALQGPRGSALKGKPIGLIMVYGDADPFTAGAVNAFRSFQDMCRFIEAPVAGMVYGTAYEAGDINEQSTVLEQAYQLGEKLGRGPDVS